MPLATTLRLLAKARGLSATDLATAIPKAGAVTVAAWLRGEKLPGRDQMDALARTLGVPAGALLAELASTLDPARTRGEHELLAAYRGMSAKRQAALLAFLRDDPSPSRAAAMPAAGARTPKQRSPAKRPAASPTTRPRAR